MTALLRVLLVDDEEVNRISLAAMLEDAGFVVVEAEGVADARARLADGGFDLVVLDKNLADGLGTELVPTIREQHPSAKVLLVSGESTADLRSSGADEFLAKGGPPEELLAVVRRLAP